MNRDQRRIQDREQRRLERAAQQEKESQAGKSAVQRAAARRAAPATKAREPFFRRVWHFLKEVRAELRRVSWPTREQMVAFTTVTMITTVVLTAFVFGIDIGFKAGLLYILELGI
jgi:preprotein translocase subunit SecE